MAVVYVIRSERLLNENNYSCCVTNILLAIYPCPGVTVLFKTDPVLSHHSLITCESSMKVKHKASWNGTPCVMYDVRHPKKK